MKVADRPQPHESYRDELNFAEFPLASLAKCLPQDQKTLEFSDKIYDPARGEEVTRKLIITASDKFGLPTALDDEVILGLIQLTAKTDFVGRTVFFTRYQLLKLLSWADTAQSYERLEQSLNRWLGVTLYYDKSWWSKEEQSWVKEGFHILDHVTILDRERQRRRAKLAEPDSGKCSFVWNEVVFNSFKAGYLKQIDYNFYKQLKSSISKRMYRFLDKRFYRGQRFEFDLRAFACEHIGLSKHYHNGELKRVLAPAIAELEAEHFLEPLSANERFIRKARGAWSVVFRRAARPGRRIPVEAPELVTALHERGVSLVSARRLVAGEQESKIREKISIFDWLRAKGDLRIIKNPAGYLYRSIVDDFSAPPGYAAAPAAKSRSIPPGPKSRRRTNADAPEMAPERAAIDAFWSAIPREEKERIEKELVETARPFYRQYLKEGSASPVLSRAVRQAMLDDYARRTMRQAVHAA